MTVPKITLKSGNEIPVVGLGTWQLQGEECERAVLSALKAGYNHIDTASAYDNHVNVSNAIKKSGIEREKLFLTSKLWLAQMEDPIDACKQALEELETEYLDLYLIHWPDRDKNITKALQGMKKLKRDGLIRSIGVSNFTTNHLKDVMYSDIQIDINQVEFHPSLNQKELKEFCDKNGITITAYSPIAQGYDLRITTIKMLAEKYNKTESQIILHWLISKRIVAIPRSSNPIHIQNNLEIFGWKMEEEDLNLLETLNSDHRVVDPNFADFGY
jgi:diketogulonate reductase-like aldo/keto reductase